MRKQSEAGEFEGTWGINRMGFCGLYNDDHAGCLHFLLDCYGIACSSGSSGIVREVYKQRLVEAAGEEDDNLSHTAATATVEKLAKVSPSGVAQTFNTNNSKHTSFNSFSPTLFAPEPTKLSKECVKFCQNPPRTK